MCVIYSLLYKLSAIDAVCVRPTAPTDASIILHALQPWSSLASAQLMHAHQRRRADGGAHGGAMGALLQDFATFRGGLVVAHMAVLHRRPERHLGDHCDDGLGRRSTFGRGGWRSWA